MCNGTKLLSLATAGKEKQPALSSEQAWQRLQAGNNRFAAAMLERQDLGASRRQELSKVQKLFAVVFTARRQRRARKLGVLCWTDHRKMKIC